MAWHGMAGWLCLNRLLFCGGSCAGGLLAQQLCAARRTNAACSMHKPTASIAVGHSQAVCMAFTNSSVPLPAAASWVVEQGVAYTGSFFQFEMTTTNTPAECLALCQVHHLLGEHLRCSGASPAHAAVCAALFGMSLVPSFTQTSLCCAALCACGSSGGMAAAALPFPVACNPCLTHVLPSVHLQSLPWCAVVTAFIDP